MTPTDHATALPPAPAGSLWQALRDAIRGTGADYTTIDGASSAGSASGTPTRS